jgi:hypothetical protein
VKFGLKGAVSMSSLSTNISEYENALNAGYQLGAFLRIGDKWHLQPEAYFAGKVGEIKYDVPIQGNISVSEKITLNTVDVPLLVGFKIIDPPTLNVRLQAGPVASFVMNKKFDVTLDGVSQDPSEEYKNAWKDINWGLQFGAGVDVLFLTIDLRYELGLSNLYSQPDNSVSVHDNVKNNLFFLSVGFKIL